MAQQVEAIANTLKELGQIQGQGIANRGQIFGGALASLGQIPGQIQQAKAQEQNQQLRQQELQIRQGQLTAQQRQQAAEDALNGAYANALSPDGSIDMNLLAQHLAGTPAASQWPKIQAGLAAAQESSLKVAKLRGEVDAAERDQIASIGNSADTASDPETKAAIILAHVASGIKTGAISEANGRPLIQQIIGHAGAPDPNAVQQVIARMKSVSASDVEKRAQAAKNMAEADKASRPVAPKLDTESELARDAATLGTPNETPTARTSKAAFDALRAEKPAEAATRGRLEAANAETLRHNKADEALAGGRLATERARLKAETSPLGGGAGAAVPDVAPGQKNEAFLQTLQPSEAAKVKALAEGRLALPARMSKGDTYWQGLLDAVTKYDPSFDAVNYNARSKTRADFTSGASAKQVNAINTVIGHLKGLSDAADALGNSDVPLFNSVTNALSRATGSPKVTNFETIKKAVADEVTRVWRQAGGSVEDIRAAQANLDAAGSPAQLHGAIATYGDLLESKLTSLNEQYRQGMGTDKIDILTPEARQSLSTLEKRVGRGASHAAPGMIRARDAQGGLHEAKAGTKLPPDWTLVP